MNYQTFAPTAALQPYVKYFYSLKTDGVAGEEKSFRIIADGCPGMLLQDHADGSFAKDGKALPASFLFGQSTRHANIDLKGNFNAIGVYLQPNALHAIFGISAQELTDSCLDLDDLATRKAYRISEQLDDAIYADKKIELISAYLLKELAQNRAMTNQTIHYALGQILSANGQVSINVLQQQLGMPERTFERKFKEYVGISPKLFARICRFQTSLKQLQSKDFYKLSDIAYQNEYADQSHFIRSFKEFAGLSPNQYKNRSNEVLENLSELVTC
jgi:AraC-like DNA-binding protein